MFPIGDNVRERRTPVFVTLLILANLAVFAFELLLGPRLEEFVLNFGLIPWEVTHNKNLPRSNLVGPGISSLTALFLHGSFFHVLSNMLFLWVFGRGVESALGHFRFLMFYIVAGYMGHFGHILTQSQSMVPTVGASGAIAGLMGAYLMLYPTARVRTVVPILFYPLFVDVPAALFLLYWFLLQMLNGVGSLQIPGGGVAWFAHIGGFLFGLFYARRRRRMIVRRRIWQE